MDIRNLFFKSRSFTPIPILLMMLYFARPNSPYFFLGIIIIVIGEIIRLRSVSFAGGETRTMNVGASSICKSGPYSIVRNPLYIGNMMIYVGFAFVAGSVYVVTISSITFAVNGLYAPGILKILLDLSLLSRLTLFSSGFFSTKCTRISLFYYSILSIFYLLQCLVL